MSAKIVTVVATFQAKPGEEADLRKALISLVVPTRQEAGCISTTTCMFCPKPGEISIPRKLGQQGAPRRASEKHPHPAAVCHAWTNCASEMPEIVIWEKDRPEISG